MEYLFEMIIIFKNIFKSFLVFLSVFVLDQSIYAQYKGVPHKIKSIKDFKLLIQAHLEPPELLSRIETIQNSQQEISQPIRFFEEYINELVQFTHHWLTWGWLDLNHYESKFHGFTVHELQGVVTLLRSQLNEKTKLRIIDLIKSKDIYQLGEWISLHKEREDNYSEAEKIKIRIELFEKSYKENNNFIENEEILRLYYELDDPKTGATKEELEIFKEYLAVAIKYIQSGGIRFPPDDNTFHGFTIEELPGILALLTSDLQDEVKLDIVNLLKFQEKYHKN